MSPDSAWTSVGCICVSPLKALINDQENRLTPLFDRVKLPLTPWHGDVTQGRKRELLETERPRPTCQAYKPAFAAAALLPEF